MERAVPILPAEDLQVAKEFYVKALGFESFTRRRMTAKLAFLGLERGTIHITLDCPMAGHGEMRVCG